MRDRQSPVQCNRFSDGCARKAQHRLRRAANGRRLTAMAAGVAAFVWLLIRSGTRPTRLAYPCQQASLASVLAIFGAPIAATLSMIRPSGASRRRGFGGPIIAAAAILMVALLVTGDRYQAQPDITIMAPPEDYAPEVYVVNNTRGVSPGRFGGVDDLVTLMGTRGFKWHRSPTPTLTSGPIGLIDPDDVVLIKINSQWPERGGTNTDVLRGVIRQVVEHLDGFVGEIVVVDNGQGAGNLDWAQSNAEDTAQSAQDVVNEFAAEGWRITAMLWDDLLTPVGEYSAGDAGEGYVVADEWDAESNIRLSYPKFQTPFGTCISYKHGVWYPKEGNYDTDALVVINVPVLKTHRIYAVTGAVKNHMGVVSQRLVSDTHGSVRWGGMGTVLAEVRRPDLNILDCTWILARPGSGPNAYYELATQRNQLLAGTDPVALDAWAVKYVLLPQIIENGFAYEDYHEMQDVDNPESMFRFYLDRSMNELLAAGIQTTSNYHAVIAHTWSGDVNRDGDVDLSDFSGFHGCLVGPGKLGDAGCVAFDANGNGSVDLHDYRDYQATFTGAF